MKILKSLAIFSKDRNNDVAPYEIVEECNKNSMIRRKNCSRLVNDIL